MADPTTVKRALRALAYGRDADAQSHTAAQSQRLLVDRAIDALTSVDDAARFCESAGTSRLREVVRRAEERGQTTLAERGREALSTLRAYRQAAAGTATDDGAVTVAAGADVRPGRGTPLPGAGQGGDR